MRFLATLRVIVAPFALLAVGCAPPPSGSYAYQPRSDAAVEVPPLVCVEPDAGPQDVATREVAAASMVCGGELAVAGLTPFGWWTPKIVRSVFQLGGCFGVTLAFTDGPEQGPEGADLYFHLKQAKSTEPWSGTFKAVGGLAWGKGNYVTVPVTVEITSATPLFMTDAKWPDDGVGPVGLVTGSIDADTGCGHVTGTFSVPYCAWSTCIL